MQQNDAEKMLTDQRFAKLDDLIFIPWAKASFLLFSIK